MTASLESNSKSTSQSLARKLDYLFMLRPTLMFPLWTMVLAGFQLSPSETELTAGRWALLALSTTALFGLVYLLNQMQDRAGDRVNQKLALVAHDLVSRKVQWGMAIALIVISPLSLVLAGYGHVGLLLTAVFAVAGFLYNFTPLALEKTPVGGILAGVAGSWLLLRLGEAFAEVTPSVIAEMPYILAFTASCILTSLPDMKGDVVSGKKTVSVAYGARFTIGAGALLIAAAGVGAALLNEWILVAAALGGGVFVAWGWAVGSIPSAVLGNKLAIFILAVGVAVQFPVFLGAIVVYYPLARWYHRVRFDLDYPSFRAG